MLCCCAVADDSGHGGHVTEIHHIPVMDEGADSGYTCAQEGRAQQKQGQKEKDCDEEEDLREAVKSSDHKICMAGEAAARVRSFHHGYGELSEPGERASVGSDFNHPHYCSSTPKSSTMAEGFLAIVSKEDSTSDLGWALDCMVGAAICVTYVSSDSDTPIGRYNEGSPLGVQIQAGDYVTWVNGQTETEKMMMELEGSETVSMRIIRPIIRKVSLHRRGRPLGLELQFFDGSQNIIVCGLRHGVVLEDEADIQINDRLLKVNSAVGGSEKLLQELRSSNTLHIVVSRLPSSE